MAEKGKKVAVVHLRSSGTTAAAPVGWAEHSGTMGQENMPTRKSSSPAAMQKAVRTETALAVAEAVVAAARTARTLPLTGTSRMD